MAKLANQLFFFTLLVVLLLHIPSITSQEVDDEREFDYDPKGEKGPARWGEIHPDWSACNNGSMQSPIDLLHERVRVVSHLGRLNRNYKPAKATLKNRGHDMMVRKKNALESFCRIGSPPGRLQWEGGAGTLRINETDYVLQQCHWHSPSEHTINGKRLAMELHMVHESHDGKVAVVGIVYKIGRPDSFLSSITNHLKSVAGTIERETAIGLVNPRDIKIGSRKYYRYIGSLTVPPCTENVSWTIVRKIRTVSREQVRLLRVAVHDDAGTNARPIQSMNNRWLQLYRPEEGKN